MTLFVFAGVANAMVLLTWAPITDKADTYWDGIGLTAINLLNVIFQIMYLPGTLLALRISERNGLRTVLLAGGLLTTGGCVIRLIGALGKDGLGASGSYVLILLGTGFVGLAQPFYLNMPAKIAATWFAVSERDVATTLCSLANPLGSAIGSFIPAMFIADDSDDAIATGIWSLLLTQLIVAGAALTLTLLVFQDAPPTPPSESAKKMLAASANPSQVANRMFHEVKNLFRNAEYVKLFFSFTIVLGNLNALAALLNQLPGNYSNGEIGLTGAALIMSGFVGAFCTGFVLDYSKAYRTVLKSSFYLTFVAWIFFLSNCREGSFGLFIASGALLGFFTLPTIPATIVSTVECSYPVPEDASVGFLYIGANVMAIAMTFIGQVLLGMGSGPDPAPFFAYGYWVMSTLLLILVPVTMFQGQYFRLEEDTGAIMA